MKSKATLVLMEQLVMLLVFALAAALCLNVFARADEISKQTARRDEAVLIAQNAAEILKSGTDAHHAPVEKIRQLLHSTGAVVPGLTAPVSFREALKGETV